MWQVPSPLPPRKPAFVLTPLIDIIFLLLVFFMLSSQIAPYSLLDVAQASRSVEGQPPLPAETTASDAATDDAEVVLQVSRGHVRAGSTTITIADLPAAITEMKKRNLNSALLLTTRSATVQDVVSVLEAFRLANFARVKLVGRPGGGS